VITALGLNTRTLNDLFVLFNLQLILAETI